MVLNAYLQIAYYLRSMRDGILQIFYFRHFSPGPDLICQDVVQHRQVMKYHNINSAYQTSRTPGPDLACNA